MDKNMNPSFDDYRAKRDFDGIMRYLDANPRVVDCLDDYLTERFDQHLHIGNAEAAAFLRSHPFVANDGSDFKVNNNMLPVLMRLICYRNPRIASHIKKRASRFDACFDAWLKQHGGGDDDR